MKDEWHYESERLVIDRVGDEIKYIVKGENDNMSEELEKLKITEKYYKERKEDAIEKLNEFNEYVKENGLFEDELVNFGTSQYFGSVEEIRKKYKEDINDWEENLKYQKKKIRRREDFEKTVINYEADVIKDQIDISSFI